jgi:diguanylate cyclase (GGDEF)-like protein/PAS domain S-box-containing protein
MQGNKSPGNPGWTRILALVGTLLLVVAVGSGFTVATINMQTATGAYIAGQSQWSRAQLAAVFALYRYKNSGDPIELERARQSLDVHIGTMQARIAMEQPELDRTRVQDGFQRGGIHADDVSRMIWLFRWFFEAPYFRDAVTVWRESDVHIHALVEVAGELEAAWAAGGLKDEQREAFSERLSEHNTALRALTHRFMELLTETTRWLNLALSWMSVVVLAALAIIAGLIAGRVIATVAGSERKFRAIFEQAAVGMAQVGEGGRLLDVNQALCEILRYPQAKLLGLSYSDLVHPEDREIGRQQRHDILAGAVDSYTIEQRLLRGDGGTVWGKLTVSGIRHEGTHQSYYIAILEDVSESRRLSVELNYQATHDSLTGLINRRAFERRLAESLRRARVGNAEHALCFIDLDQFKIVNDTSGHFAGDHLLRQVADIFRRTLREGDLLARLGGDEFGMILENCSLDTASMIAEKLRKALDETSFAWDDRSFSIGCSVGLVPITAASADTSSLLRAADIACYLAKEQGRNRVYVSRDDDQQLAERRGEMEWLSRIRAALQAGRMFLDAQRLMSLETPDSLRYEVLVRLRDESGEVIPPGAFLPAAERFGAAHQIDRWVIEHVFAELAANPEHLARLEACHINLSGRSFDQIDFHEFVLAMFDRYELPANKICFEITETAAVRNLVDVMGFMEHLRERGCSFALDDFGAGLSSFGYLRRLPVDYLKIDGVFVRDIANDETDLAMVRAINEIGQTLHKKIIAEFVETDAALDMLREMGVHYVQGYGVHRPCSFKSLLSDAKETKPLGQI